MDEVFAVIKHGTDPGGKSAELLASGLLTQNELPH